MNGKGEGVKKFSNLSAHVCGGSKEKGIENHRSEGGGGEGKKVLVHNKLMSNARFK